MTDFTANTQVSESAPADFPAGQPRGFFASAIRETFARTGARLGIVWIAIVVGAAVLAPLLANSHPILTQDAKGQWDSPMVRNFDYIDITLLSMAICGGLLFALRRRIHGGIAVGALLFGSIVLLLFTSRYFPAAEAPYLSRYREDLRDGVLVKSITTIIPYSPSDRLRDMPSGLQDQPPSRDHWFGTTGNAEDVLSRMMYASRTAVSVGFVSTGIALLIGVIVGGLMGYFVGTVDLIGMRIIEIIEAIPSLFLIIMFVTFYGRNLYFIMAIIGLTGWTGNARFIRAEFLRLRGLDFVQAAKAMGLPLPSILFRHMLPNGISPVLISASFGVASAILTESYLSFLGLGLVDAPSWGKMLDDARGMGTSFNWWMAVFPGAAIFFTVFAYNLIGESVRDALDPKLRKRE